jgi:T-complex protein 1 subunit beta
LRLQGNPNLDAIHIIKKTGGSLRDSYLDEGFILEKKIGVGQPKRLENPKILIANTAMDTDKIKIFGSRVRVTSTAELSKIEEAERVSLQTRTHTNTKGAHASDSGFLFFHTTPQERMIQKCQRIVDHGINCFINRQLIYNLPEQFFADHGVAAIEHADFEGIERLALVTGAEIVSTFDHPEKVKLGTCKLIEEIMIGEDKVRTTTMATTTKKHLSLLAFSP